MARFLPAILQRQSAGSHRELACHLSKHDAAGRGPTGARIPTSTVWTQGCRPTCRGGSPGSRSRGYRERRTRYRKEPNVPLRMPLQALPGDCSPSNERSRNHRPEEDGGLGERVLGTFPSKASPRPIRLFRIQNYTLPLQSNLKASGYIT